MVDKLNVPFTESTNKKKKITEKKKTEHTKGVNLIYTSFSLRTHKHPGIPGATLSFPAR